MVETWGRDHRLSGPRALAARGLPDSRQSGHTHHAPRHMNTTMRSSKEEIATAAVEIIDTQAEEITQLRQRQVILWALVALLLTLQVL